MNDTTPPDLVPVEEQSQTPSDQQPDSPQDDTRPDADEIERMIAEAEQRGYLRGRNEQIEELLMRPDSDSMPDEFCALDVNDDSCPGFLANIRPDFWD